MNITRAAIKYNRVTTVAILGLIFGGLASYASMPRAMDPGLTIRVARVITMLPGASPERIENLVTDPIERVVQEMPELDFVSSTSKAGVSIVMVNVSEKYANMRPIWDRLRRKIDDVRPTLPRGVRGPTINDEFGDTFGIVIALSGDGFGARALKDVADEVRDELLRISETAKVTISGAQQERVFIEYSSSELTRLKLSPMQLKSILESRNIIIPGGSISTGDETIVLEPSGNFESIQELENTVIRLPGRSELLYLKNIVHDIRRGYSDPPQSAMGSSIQAHGGTTLGLAISLREGGNIITLGKKINALLDRLRDQYPHGIEFEIIAFLPRDVEAKVGEFGGNVVQSVLIVLIAMIVFLGLRTGLLIASLIPTTMVMSILIMNFLDIGIDQMSLASLIIALGILVDNAIVMTEATIVRLEAGEGRVEAAVGAATELRGALLTSSLTTAAAFLPIFLAESAVGEYTNPLFKVVTIALLSSWCLALTMIPLLCVWFLRTKNDAKQRGGRIATLWKRLLRRDKSEDDDTKASRGGEFDGVLYRMYRRGLLGALRHRALSMGITLAVFVVAMLGFSKVPKVFFPVLRTPRFTATLRLPVGTPIEKTERVVAQLEDYMRSDLMANKTRKDGIKSWGTFIGVGAPRYILGYSPEPPAPEYAYMIINTTNSSVVHELMRKLERFVERFPDLQARIAMIAAGPPVLNPVEIRLSGKDPDRLFAIVQKVKARLRGDTRLKAIADDRGPWTKKIKINVAQTRAMRSGVTNQDIAVSMLTNLSGIETTQYRESNRVIPVILRAVDAPRTDLGKLETLSVYSQRTGNNVPLAQVSDPLRITMAPAKVQRRDRLRTITVSAQLASGYTAAEVNADLIPWLDKETEGWGLGYRYEIGGEYETSGKANASIGAKLPVAGLIILILLVLQFNSIRRTIIIIFTIPMALIGVVVGLLAARSYFGFMTLLGVVSLSGIVINNAIVLLGRVKTEIEENGLPPASAVIIASQRRLRPILLTTITTIGGLLPLWFGGGAMWEPLAIAIIFGLLFSTVLTLGLVPVLYSILFRVTYRDFDPTLLE